MVLTLPAALPLFFRSLHEVTATARTFPSSLSDERRMHRREREKAQAVNRDLLQLGRDGLAADLVWESFDGRPLPDFRPPENRPALA